MGDEGGRGDGELIRIQEAAYVVADIVVAEHVEILRPSRADRGDPKAKAGAK
jgi:hypothetical protein